MRSFLAAAFAALVVAAGCGGSDDPGDDAAGGRTADEGEHQARRRAEKSADRSHDTARPDRRQEAARTPLSPQARRRDSAQVEQVVRALLEGMNTQDETVCTRLFDRHLVEASRRDDEADRCRQAIAHHPGGVELVRIESLRLRQSSRFGREALVTFVVQQKRRTSRLAFHLMKTGGRYLIDRGVPAGG